MSVSEKTVSVIIPFYNGSDCIERAVKSVFEQTCPAKELIIVNDGSRPEERAALDTLQRKYDFRVIDQENGGQGSARNTGVREAASEYICFLDQDDFYLPGHISDLLAAVPRNQTDFGYIFADYSQADMQGKIICVRGLREEDKAPKKDLIALLRKNLYVLPSATLIDKKVFMTLGGFDEQFTGYEDDDLFLRFFLAGYPGIYLDKPVYVWCRNTASTSFSTRMTESRLRYFQKLCARFRDDPKQKAYCEAVFRHLFNDFRYDLYLHCRQRTRFPGDGKIREDYEKVRAIVTEFIREALSMDILSDRFRVYLRVLLQAAKHPAAYPAFVRMTGIGWLKKIYKG